MEDATLKSRYEIKYLVPASRIEEIKEGFGGLFVADPNNVADRGYFNHSVYFDSPSFDAYTEKHEGLSQRIKPRLRLYKETEWADPKGYFLELKKRTDRVLYKERAPVSREVARDLIAKRTTHHFGGTNGSDVLAQFHYLNHVHPLVPAVAILYHRSAYHSPIYPKLRLTFDRAIKASLDTSLDAARGAFVYAVDPRQMIVELKYTDRVPDIVLQRCRRLGLTQVTFSKFATGLERCLDGRRMSHIGV